MSKVTPQARKKYQEKVQEYKKNIETMKKKEAQLQQLADKEKRKAPFCKIQMANENLNMVSYYCVMNNVSLSLLGVKNENFLNEGRKACYKAIIYLEEVVSRYLDVPFHEYEDKLKQIEVFTPDKRYNFIRKIGFSIQTVVDGFGLNSKWKWSFVEMEGRFAVISKNLLDLKQLKENMDPRAEYYDAVTDHVRIARDLLSTSADAYREKYELSTSRFDDFQQAINFLSALKRLYFNTDTARLEDIKKKIEVWKTFMEKEMKTKSKKSLRDRLKKNS